MYRNCSNYIRFSQATFNSIDLTLLTVAIIIISMKNLKPNIAIIKYINNTLMEINLDNNYEAEIFTTESLDDTYNKLSDYQIMFSYLNDDDTSTGLFSVTVQNNDGNFYPLYDLKADETIDIIEKILEMESYRWKSLH